MKRNVLSKTLGSVALVAAFGLIACSDDTSSNTGTGSGDNMCEALTPECGYTEEKLCEMGVMKYCPSYNENCVHISDSDSAGRWDCTEPDYTLKEDCGNPSALYMCAAGMWIEAKDCDPSQDRCGYSDTTLCTQFGIMEYCDGPSNIFPVGVPCNKPGKSVVIDGQWMYRCDNGKWHVVVPLG